jgi:hypothetical protein
MALRARPLPIHLGFGHFERRFQQREWELACEYVVWQYLSTKKNSAYRPNFFAVCQSWSIRNCQQAPKKSLFRYFRENGTPDDLPSYSLTGSLTGRAFSDMIEASQVVAHPMVVGGPKAFRIAVRKNNNGLRHSGLQERLRRCAGPV